MQLSCNLNLIPFVLMKFCAREKKIIYAKFQMPARFLFVVAVRRGAGAGAALWPNGRILNVNHMPLSACVCVCGCEGAKFISSAI